MKKAVPFLCLMVMFSEAVRAQSDVINIISTGNVGISSTAPVSSLDVSGSYGQKVTTVTGNTILDVTHNTVVCNNGATAITLTLPTASTASGRVYVIKKNGSSTGTVTVTPNPTLDGLTTLVLTLPNQVLEVFSDGAEWKTREGGLSANASAWNLSGNSGTTASTSAIGVAANNNFIGTTDAKDFVIASNGFERMRIGAGGNVGIGTSAPETPLHIATESTSTPRGLMIQQSNTGNNSPFLVLRKGRGTIAAPSAITNGDALGTIYAEGYDGTAFTRAGSNIKFVSNGTIASGSIPSDITFSTGSSGVGTERMRILSSGEVGVGNSAPAVLMDIKGNNVGYGGQLRLSAADYGQITFYNSANLALSAANRLGDIYYDVAGSTLYMENQAGNKYINFNQGGGNVGIGITTPSSFKLQTAGDVGPNADLTYNLGSPSLRWNNLYVNSIQGPGALWTRTGTNLYNTTLTDNVGIGTSSPLARLHVNAGATAGEVLIGDNWNTPAADASTRVNIGNSAANTTIKIGQATTDYGSLQWVYNATPANGYFQIFSVKNGVSGGNIVMQETAGNVGIGTGSPVNLLHISGSNDNNSNYYSQQRIDGTGTYPLNIAGISLNPNAAVQSHIRFFENGTPKVQIRYNLGNVADNKLKIYSFTTGTDFATFDAATGNVGIGSTTAGELLHVRKDQNLRTAVLVENQTAGTASQAAYIAKNDVANVAQLGMYSSTATAYGAIAANNAYLYTGSPALTLMADNASGVIKFTAGGNAEKMRIQADGNVGIGTTTAADLLNISFNSNASKGSLIQNLNAGTGAYGRYSLINDANNQAGLLFGSTLTTGYAGANGLAVGTYVGGGNLQFYTVNNARMTIDVNGNVGIGTTTPASFKVQSAGDIGPNADLTYNLGSASLRWNNLYVNSIQGPGALWTRTGTNLYNTTITDNVGIGSTVPVQRLDVGGRAVFHNAGTLYNNPAAAEVQIGYGLAAPTTAGEVARLALQPYAHGAGPFIFVNRDDPTYAYLDIRYGTSATSSILSLIHTGYVGIGTQNPDRPLTVLNNSEWNIASRSANTTSTNRNHFLAQRANGTSAVSANFTLGGLAMGGYDGTNYSLGWNGGTEITGYANQTWTAANRGAYMTFSTTADNTAVSTERMRITSNGNVGIGTPTPGNTRVYSTYSPNDGANHYIGIRSDIAQSGAVPATASTLVRGMYTQAYTSMTRLSNSYPLSYGIDAVSYTDGANQFNWLRGGNFAAFSNSSATTLQDAIAGTLSSGYNNGSGTVSSVYGAYNQGYSNSTGATTTAIGSINLGMQNSGSGNINTAYGSLNQVVKQAGGTGNITTGYGTYSQVYSGRTSGTDKITTAFAYYGDVSTAAGGAVPTIAYGLYLNNASGTSRYGVYSTGEIFNYFSGNVGIGTTTPKEKLHVNGALVTQNGQVKRDFFTWNTTGSSNNPIHIKTNITMVCIMYRFLVEGFHYYHGLPINCETVGYADCNPFPTAVTHNSSATHSGTASVSTYKSSDGYLVIKVSPGSADVNTSYYIGFSVSGWFTNPAGQAFDVQVLTSVQQAANL